MTRGNRSSGRGSLRLVGVLVIALVLASCAGETAPPGATEAPGTTAAADDPLAALAAAAEAEEGSLEYYFVLGEEYLGPLVDGFRAAYPFVELNVTTAGTLQLIEKVVSENETGNQIADLIQGGPLEDSVLCGVEELCYSFRPSGEANVPEQFRFGDAPFVVPAYFTFHIAYNTNEVSAEEAPTSLEDLAAPEWQGRFGIDTEVIDWFAAELAFYGEEAGLELFGRLAENDPVIYSGAQGYEQLAAGALPATINAYSLLLPTYIEAGAPIAVAQADHMIALPDEFIGINTTDNPKTLELFFEWLFTEEAQQIQPDHLGKTPVTPGVSIPDTLTGLSGSCTGDCELFFGTSENFGDFDVRVQQFQELFVEG
jgi:iron(III) transport system substrate-binding protein